MSLLPGGVFAPVILLHTVASGVPGSALGSAVSVCDADGVSVVPCVGGADCRLEVPRMYTNRLFVTFYAVVGTTCEIEVVFTIPRCKLLPGLRSFGRVHCGWSPTRGRRPRIVEERTSGCRCPERRFNGCSTLIRQKFWCSPQGARKKYCEVLPISL